MTVARMHSQRQVQRGRDVARYTGQKRITRGGDDPNAGGGGGVPATGATAGIPGTWTPPGSTRPATVANLQGGVPNAVTATPTTGWTIGQYVQTATAGAPGEATWTGTGWVGGRSLASGDPTTFLAANHTIAEIEAWVDANPQYADEALSWEEGHQNRVTLMDWLEGFISDRDPGHVP